MESNPCRLTVDVVLPDTAYLSPDGAVLSFYDINRNSEQLFVAAETVDDSTLRFCFEVEKGFYNLTFKQNLLYKGNELLLRAYLNNRVVATDEVLPPLMATVSMKQNDFVLAEIFFSGTVTPEGKQYTGDKYFVLYNNTDSVLYADGLVLMESKFLTARRDLVTPDMMDSAMTVDAIYRIPGDGTRFPVEPSRTLLIADNAMDHRTMNSNSFDLSHADVEWYDQSTSATVTDVDNPEVPNMDKLYCYTQTIWIPHNQGHKAFAIGRLPKDMSDEQYLKQYFYAYDYQTVTQAGTFSMSGEAYLFPNEWIVDAVNLAPATTFQWLVTSERLDAGYTYVAQTGSDKTRYGLSVRRKQFIDGNGVSKLQDTNNSTDDFLTAQTADPYFFRQ